MIVRTLNLCRFYLRLTCDLLPLAAFVIAGYVRFSRFNNFSMHDYDPVAYFHLLLLTTVVWAIAAEHYDVTSPEKLFVENTGARGAFAACAVTYMVLFTAAFYYRDVSFSRVFFAVSGLTLLLGAVVMRAVFRRLVRRGALSRGAPIRVLIIGADKFARRAAARLARSAMPRCTIVGFVRLPQQQITADADNIYELADLTRVDGVEEIVVALPPELWPEIPRVMLTLGRLSVPVRAIIDVWRGFVVRDRFFQIGRLNILDLGSSSVDTLNYVLLKRAFDIVFSLFIMVVMSPVMLLIAVAVRLSSPGPVLFVQDRIGLNGKIFRMYKFRTMTMAETAESDTRHTTRHDSRCTRVGAMLRASSLDELPQFFNVIKGDMSVVGPRPELPHFVRRFLEDIAKYNNRHRLKVGITGWAQVNGLRGDTSISRRVTYDLYYLQNWSLAFDLRIIMLTIWAGLSRKNAY
jgi:Undecaprenyl-phosphate glucose phosphotransferase